MNVDIENYEETCSSIKSIPLYLHKLELPKATLMPEVFIIQHKSYLIGGEVK